MNKTVQDTKVKTESIKKTKTEKSGNEKFRNWEDLRGKLQQQVIRGVKDMIEEMDTLVKENVDSKILLAENWQDF